MRLHKLRQLTPLLQLCLWSIMISLISFTVSILTKDHNEETGVKYIQEVTEEPFKGNNLNNYIELIKMPPETVFKNIRVMITNKKNNSIFFDRDNFNEVAREIEAKKYRGEIIYHEAKGNKNKFVVINELPLEEYLYSVVPSEMPASYPMEALKAQAICARTYAVIHMMNPAYPDYDAHVNDTTSFQVYHNMEEQETTNKAVDETVGQLLFEDNGEELVETFYYSTSCGQTCEASTNVEFKEYISKTDHNDYEVQEGWYRWNCQVSVLDKNEMRKRMQSRYQSAKSNVLTMTGKDCYESMPVNELGIIRELFISKRGTGGVGEELIITTDKNTYKIVGEYNIRYVLNDSDTEIVKQDGTKVKMSTLLPSAFIALDAVKENSEVTGYRIIGGGYGHGVGMSQNGAKEMASRGSTTEEILNYYYPGCLILDNL